MKQITKEEYKKLKKHGYAGKDEKGYWMLYLGEKGTTYDYVEIVKEAK